MDCSNSRPGFRARGDGLSRRWRVLSRDAQGIDGADQPRGQPARAHAGGFADGEPHLTTNTTSQEHPVRRYCAARSCITRTGAGRIPERSREHGGYFGMPLTGGRWRGTGPPVRLRPDALPLTSHQRMICEILADALPANCSASRRTTAARQREPHGTRARRVARAASPSARPGRDHRHEPGARARPRRRCAASRPRMRPCSSAAKRAPARSSSRAPSMRQAAGPKRLHEVRLRGAAIAPAHARVVADGEGALDLASGGTILLDEIARLRPMRRQAAAGAQERSTCASSPPPIATCASSA